MVEKKKYFFSIKDEIYRTRIFTKNENQYLIYKSQHDYLMEKYNFDEDEDIFLLSMYDSPLKTFLYSIIDRVSLIGGRDDKTGTYFNLFVPNIITFEKDLIEECSDHDLTKILWSPSENNSSLVCQVELTEKEYCKFIMLKK